MFYENVKKGYRDEPILYYCGIDENLKPVKKGDIGEICVRGTGLALGYYNDSQKTALAFVKNPFISWRECSIMR